MTTKNSIPSIPSIPKSDKSVKYVPSVNTLESLVPPVDLCSKIPDGIFADSALIWCYDGDFWHVEARSTSFYNKEEDIRPAPTLQEILNELPKYNENEVTLACVPSFLPGDKGRIFGEAWSVGYTAKSNITDANPVTAALKLWLELNKKEEEK